MKLQAIQKEESLELSKEFKSSLSGKEGESQLQAQRRVRLVCKSAWLLLLAKGN